MNPKRAGGPPECWSTAWHAESKIVLPDRGKRSLEAGGLSQGGRIRQSNVVQLFKRIRKPTCRGSDVPGLGCGLYQVIFFQAPQVTPGQPKLRTSNLDLQDPQLEKSVGSS